MSDEADPFFPPNICLDGTGEVVEGGDGISIRDHYAGIAMRALLQSNPDYSPDDLADRAFEIADAMIDAR